MTLETAAKTITLTINGEKQTIAIEAGESLLDLLRERLDLIGAKNACGYGKCGACTVVMNDNAVRACITKAEKCDGAEIVTIEGISDGFDLHPIQEAFIEEGAIQCGYCTPGFVMTLYALFTSNPDAAEDEIKKALQEHLCRCTGYENIWKAALSAQGKMKIRGLRG